jgi:hypothetical protein
MHLNDVRYEVLTAVVMKISIFWDITPCRPLKVNRRFWGTCRLHLYVESCLAYSLTLKTEAMCSSETSADFQRTTRRYIPEGRTLHLNDFWILYIVPIFLQYEASTVLKWDDLNSVNACQCYVFWPVHGGQDEIFIMVTVLTDESNMLAPSRVV